MFIDSQLQLSDAQALTATADSTNVVDLGEDRDIGRGEPVALVVTVGVAADNTTGNETYTFQLETDDNAAMTSSTVIAGGGVAATALTAGSVHVFPIGLSNEQYLQGVYTLGGTTPSVTIDAAVQPMSMIASNSVVYPAGYVVA